MRIELAPEVAELLSDEQIGHVRSQADSSEAALCVRCGELIEASVPEANLVLVADPSARRAAARLCHPDCGPSEVLAGEIPDPPDARLARRWATFVLPRVPLLVLEPGGGVWVDEQRPALMRMLERLGFRDGAEAFDSKLFATGEREVPMASGVELERHGADLRLRTTDGQELELLPGAAATEWAELLEELGGALVAVSDAAELPDGDSPVAFEDLLPRLMQGLAAFVPLAVTGAGSGPQPAETS